MHMPNLNSNNKEPVCKPSLPNKSEDPTNPNHYKTNANECFDEMIHLFGIEAVKAFCKCNVHKYRYRAEHKNGDEDLKKADWYMNKLIELDSMDNQQRCFSWQEELAE